MIFLYLSECNRNIDFLSNNRRKREKRKYSTVSIRLVFITTEEREKEGGLWERKRNLTPSESDDESVKEEQGSKASKKFSDK